MMSELSQERSARLHAEQEASCAAAALRAAEEALEQTHAAIENELASEGASGLEPEPELEPEPGVGAEVLVP
eukprot:SAG31_NODE_10518_length_1129_cov_1.367961_1_plen_72_part_00